MAIKLVKKPPSLDLSVFSSPDLLKVIQGPVAADLFHKANDEYLPWDKFRWLPMPDGLDSKAAWTFLRLTRRTQLQRAPFADEKGNPFRYALPNCVLKALNDVDRCSGENIVTPIPGDLPDRDWYIVSSLMEEAIASSQLEGASTTRRVAKEMLRKGRKPINRAERMIANNWITMEHLRENLNSNLTLEDLLAMHSRITEDTLDDPTGAGRLRTNDDIHVFYQNQIIHTPPPAASLDERVHQFCEFASHDDPNNWIHPVVKACMLHFWIGYDHPFVDGNGRTARAVFYWYMLSRGYRIFEYLAISRFFLRSPVQYARSYLYSETDEGDLTYFIKYNLKVIQLAFRDLHHYMGRKQKELNDISVQLRRYPGLNQRQRQILANAVRHASEEYTIDSIKTTYDVSYMTARKDLNDLVEQGMFESEKSGKTFAYWPVPDLSRKLSTARSQRPQPPSTG